MKTKFLTVTECCKQNPAHAKLIRAVVKQLGGMDNDLKDTMKNILSHGIDGGYSGFIYYSDTVKFAVKNQKAIVALLEEQAGQLGEDVVEMVKNFNSFNKYIAGLRCNTMDKDDEKELYLFLAGHAGRCKGHTVTNVLAWYACEEVCRMFLPEF